MNNNNNNNNSPESRGMVELGLDRDARRDTPEFIDDGLFTGDHDHHTRHCRRENYKSQHDSD